MTRVVVLGLDAAEESVVDTLIDEGALPRLAQLRARAATVALRSPEPYRAEFPWNEFTTGRTAESLRYWSTVDFDPAEYCAFMRGAPESPPFWDLGTDTPVVVFDLPKAVRPDAIPGIQLLGWGAHSPQYPLGAVPAGMNERLEARFGPHAGLPMEHAGGWHQPDYLQRLATAQASGARTRAEALRWLAGLQPDWQLCATQFGELHQTGHVTFHGFGGVLADAPTAPTARAAMIQVLRAVDDAIGAIVDWAPEDAVVVVVSVQGMGPADDDTAGSLVPELMLRAFAGESRRPSHDLQRWRAAGAPPVIPRPWDDPLAWTRRDLGLDHIAPARDRVRTALWDTVPAAMRAQRRMRERRAARRRPAPAVPPVTDDTFPYRDRSMDEWHHTAWYRDTWPRLPAFVIPSYSDAHIRINLVGREAAGIVAPDDYDAACDRVEAVLRASGDARTGGPAVLDVVRMRADDPYATDGPSADLVVRLAETDAIEHPELGAMGPAVAPRTGSHRASGFAYLAGPGIAPGPRRTHRVRDVSATVCALLGATPSGGLEGTPILEPCEHR